MSEGIGNIEYNSPTGALIPPAVPFAGAINGVSQNGAGQVVLGNDVAGTLAKLVSNREIPMNGFSLAFTGIGNTVTGFPIFRTDVARAVTTPIWQIQDSTSTELASFRMPDNQSIFIGFNAGAVAAGGNRSVGIGFQVLQNYVTTFRNTAVGYQAMGTGAGTGIANVAIGDAALINNAAGTLSSFVGSQSGQSNTSGSRNSGLGALTLNLRTSASDNTAVGANCMSESLVATNNSIQNTGIGSGCMQQQNVGNNNVGIGHNCGFNNTILAGNVMIGQGMFTPASTVGNTNVLIGQGLTSPGNIGDNNINLGALNVWNLAAITNSGLIGRGMTISVSNILAIGRADQNIIMGVTAPAADNGNRLQISGKLNTGGAAPLTLGAGAADFGKVVTAASALNATKYWEVSIDGVLLKVCIN